MAEWPERVKSIFICKSDTNWKLEEILDESLKYGVFCVNILDAGEPIEMLIDDYFPFWKENEEPCFSKCRNGEVWVMILEKVWAKLHKGYGNIWAGHPTECLHDLTGGPTKLLHTKNEDIEKLWNLLLEYENKNYIMNASTYEDNEGIAEKINSKGLAANHAYSILSAQ